MKRILPALLAIAIIAALASVASAACTQPIVELKPGMKVIAALAGPNWALATVDSVKGGTTVVTFNDGGLGSVGKGEVVAYPSALYGGGNPPCFSVGASVIAPAQGDTWRAATVLSISGDSAEVKFSDGRKKGFKLTEIVAQPK